MFAPLCRFLFAAFVAGAALAVPHSGYGGKHGSCTTPTIRKEWRTLSAHEQAAFLSAVNCLATVPHNTSIAPDGSEPDVPPVNATSNRYDDFVFTHMDGVIRNHFTGVFLSWHRWFLHTFESELKSHCNFQGTLPYWDWSLDVANITAAPLFKSDPHTGFGTFNPDPSVNFSVTDGAFGHTIRAYPTPHLVGRDFRPQPFETELLPFPFTEPDKLATAAFTPSEIEFITTHFTGNYTDFQAYMDGVTSENGRAEGMHNAAHLMMDGDMSNLAHSPNDPVFFLHHANLDRIWRTWQLNDPANKFAIGGGLTQNLTNYDDWPAGAPPFVTANVQLKFSGLTEEPLLGQVLDTEGGLLCYDYVNL